MTAPRRCRYWRCRKSFIGKREGARFCSDECRTKDYAEHHPRVHLKRQPAHKAGKRRRLAKREQYKAQVLRVIDGLDLDFLVLRTTEAASYVSDAADRIMEIFDR